MAIRLYRIIAASVVWLFFYPWSLVRLCLGRTPRHELEERMGKSRIPPFSERKVLLHGVSAGELASCGRVLAELPSELSSHVVLSTRTSSGRAYGRRLQSCDSRICEVTYLPWDYRGFLSRWFRGNSITLVVVFETELWPELFLTCASEGIPLYIFSGRIYHRDVKWYRLTRFLFREVLAAATKVFVQNGEEARRFRIMGASPDQISIAGNPKLDPILKTLPSRRKTGVRKTIVGASTHRGEEKILLEVFAGLLKSDPHVRLILAPRHPSRAERVARQSRRMGLETALLSKSGWPDQTPEFDWQVLMIDQMGRMSEVYARASLAVMGGSFRHKGGQNFVEPLAVGCPVIVGPHMENFAGFFEMFSEAEAVLQARDESELAVLVEKLIGDFKEQRRLCARARGVLRRHEGVAARYAETLQELITRGEAKSSENLGLRKAHSQTEPARRVSAPGA